MPHKEIQDACVQVMAGFGVDFSEEYQSMSFFGLVQMRRNIPRAEKIQSLKEMEGVVLDLTEHRVRIPTHYFVK
jgi:hypothetical protein